MMKICFVIGLYGEEVNGGAEKHCKMLAERLSSSYEVEVLTSTIKDYTQFDSFFSAGLTEINNVKVRRFPTDTFNRQIFQGLYKKSRLGRKIRKTGYRLGLLKAVADVFPRWNLALKNELETLKSNGLYSSALINYLVENEADYRAIFLLSYPNPNFYFINKQLAHKCVLIPTAHDEGDFFRSYLSHVFTTVKHIAFNTEAEKMLCYHIFGKRMAQSSLLAVGVEIAEPAAQELVVSKFHLPQRYILYFGRIAKEKVGPLMDWFLTYKKEKHTDVKLVLTGGLYMDPIEDDAIIYTGFVDEHEKTSLIRGAELVINPSDRESLSLLLLETMYLGRPLLVNGKSEVLRQHCIASDYAAEYYDSKNDFLSKLDIILNKESQADQRAKKAKDYVAKHYSWEIVQDRFTKIINDLISDQQQ